MRIAPFNAKEIAALQQPLKDHGWVQRNRVGDKHRFFMLPKERVVSLSVVHAIDPPVKVKPSFSLARATFGLMACVGMVKDEFLNKLALYWAGKLKEVDGVFSQVLDIEALRALKVDPETRTRIKSEFADALPDFSTEKDEHAVLQLVRTNLATRKSALDYATSKRIVETFKSLNLLPARDFEDVIELKDGVPPTLIDRLLIFKNPDHPELVMLEPGFVTYRRDVELENVLFRVQLDSYALEPLAAGWGVDLAALMGEFIKALRLGFTACLNLTGIADFKKVYFVKRNFDLIVRDHFKSIDARAVHDELVFPVPLPWFETLQTSLLSQPTWNLFTKPPETFDELTGRRAYLEARRQAKVGNVSELISSLTATLPVFNKSGQKYAFFLVLVELGRLAVKVSNLHECKAKYDLALDFAIKNDVLVNKDEYITIQEEYAEASVKLGDVDNAIRQYTLLFNYLERSRPETDSKRIDVLVKLNKIFVARSDFMTIEHEIQGNFKKIKEFGEKHKDRFVTANYYLVLGMYHEKHKKPSQALDAYQKGVSEAGTIGLIEPAVACLVRQAAIQMYGKKKNLQQAEKLLLQANQLVGTTENLQAELEIYDMLHDLYNQKDDMELAAHFNKESQRLRMALKARGE